MESKRSLFFFMTESLWFISFFLSSSRNVIRDMEFNLYTSSSSIILLSYANLDYAFSQSFDSFLIFFVSFTFHFFKVCDTSKIVVCFLKICIVIWFITFIINICVFWNRFTKRISKTIWNSKSTKIIESLLNPSSSESSRSPPCSRWRQIIISNKSGIFWKLMVFKLSTEGINNF